MLEAVTERLESLATIGSNWDSYGAPAPNSRALTNAYRVLGMLNLFDLTSAKIIPSAEGGVGFCFVRGDRYADIELSNDGEILGVRYAGRATPVLISTDGSDDSIQVAINEIRYHVLS
jgi:hypothetical protein